jgi:hypothetical protein
MAVNARNDSLTVLPKGLISVGGHTRVRRVGFVVDLTQFKCPDGHRVHEYARINEDGHPWCTYRERAGAKECGALFWILLVPQRGKRRKFYAADVTAAEMHDWEARHLEVDDIFAQLGVIFSNAA